MSGTGDIRKLVASGLRSVLKSRPEVPVGDGFVSALDDPRRRFLACVSHHGLTHGMRTYDDFIRHFSPRVLMAAIGDDAELRAELLEATLGMKRKVGLRKSPTSAGDDLQIALEEDVTSSEMIVTLFAADHRARCLDGAELWAYATEAEFWKATSESEPAWSLAREHIAYILERGLAEQLLTPRKVVDGLTLALLVHYLPEPVMESILAATLRRARIQEPFSEDELVEIVPPSVLAEHVPLEEIWERVVVPFVAEAHDLVGGRSRRPVGGDAPLAAERTRIAAGGIVPQNPLPRLPSSRLVGMPMPKLAARVASPPTGQAQPESSATKRASRAPRRSIPPKG